MVLSSVKGLSKVRRLLRPGCALAALAAGMMAGAVAAEEAKSPEAESAQAYTFNVAPQSLHSALNQWSLLTGKDWGHIGASLTNIRTEGANGQFTDHGALARILSGTGYTFNIVGTDAVSIVPVQTEETVVEAAPEAAAAEQDHPMDIIVVRTGTPQRRYQNIQDVPVAVSAFDEAMLDRRQMISTADLNGNVLNLIGSNNVGQGTSVTYFMRGVGSLEVIPTFDLPVGTYVDEVFISRQNANQVRLSGVERVEVLRGPQGTLFGRNTTGGAISIITKKPHEALDAGMEIGYGSYERLTASGYANVPVAENFYSRISAFVVNEEGFLENALNDDIFNGERAWGVRGAVRLEPMPRLIWDISLQYTDTEYLKLGTPEILTGPVTQEGTNVPITGDLFVARLTDGECEPTGAPTTWPLQGCHFTGADSLLTISNLEYTFDVGTLNLITGYYDADLKTNIDFLGNTNQPVFGGALGTSFYISNLSKNQQFSQEIKWTGDLLDGRISYVSGFYFMDEDNETHFTDTLFSPFFAPGMFATLAERAPLINTTQSFAFYTQADIGITEDLTLQAGVRWTEEDKDLSLKGRFFDFGTFSLVPVDSADLEALGIPLHLNASRWTPRVALSYDLTEDVMVYASFTQGFKSGGWNARGNRVIELQPFDPELVDSYEVGLRSQWFDERLLVNATLFRAVYDQYQVPTAVPFTTQLLTLNSGVAEVDGVEMEIAASLTETLHAFANLGLMDGKYRELSPGAIAAGIGPKLQRTPKVMMVAGFVKDFYLSGGHLLQLSSNLKYTGEFEMSPTNIPWATIDPTLLHNAQLSWTAPDKHWRVIAECKNCADEEWFTQNFFNVLYPADPRRWGVRVQYRY